MALMIRIGMILCALPLLSAQAPKKDSKKAPPPPPPAAVAEGPADAGAIKVIPYRPTLVRDPFQSLSDANAASVGDFVDDVTVKGRIVRDGKVLALVTDSRGATRWLEVGYKFKDGEIVSIDSTSVTFNQWDPNTTNRSVSRKVVKLFKREEAKR